MKTWTSSRSSWNTRSKCAPGAGCRSRVPSSSAVIVGMPARPRRSRWGFSRPHRAERHRGRRRSSGGDVEPARPGLTRRIDEGPRSIAQISNGGGSEITAGPGFTPVKEDRLIPTGDGHQPPRAGIPVRLTSACAGRGRSLRIWIATPSGNRVAIVRNWPGGRSTDLFAEPVARFEPGASIRASEEPPRPTIRRIRPSGPVARVGHASRFQPEIQAPVCGRRRRAERTGDRRALDHPGRRSNLDSRGGSDRVSPIEVDLGGEGTFGLCLVARSASGLGDQPPAPGDPPQSWVEVDDTPPVVQIQPLQVGTGVNAGKVAISWKASDLHLSPKSVTLSWRPDQPGACVAEHRRRPGQRRPVHLERSASVPERFHLKVEAIDSVGHQGSAETTESGPIVSTAAAPAAASSASTRMPSPELVPMPGPCVERQAKYASGVGKRSEWSWVLRS